MGLATTARRPWAHKSHALSHVPRTPPRGGHRLITPQQNNMPKGPIKGRKEQMAHVIGPNSGLPGTRHHLPAGSTCDDHPDRPAVARVQGETDSFGAELNDLCQECLDQFNAHQAEMRTGMCDWCSKPATDLTNRRDIDEGSTGRVYRVCGACRKAESERLDEELAEIRDHFYDFED